jgi:hypothetical protein
MEKKITKKEYYAMLKDIVRGDSNSEMTNSQYELIKFIDKQIEAIETKAEKAKEKAAEKKANGDELREVVQSVLTDEYQTIDTIVSQIEGEDITKAKITARLTSLVKAGLATKSDLRNEETGKTQKAYKLI